MKNHEGRLNDSTEESGDLTTFFQQASKRRDAQRDQISDEERAIDLKSTLTKRQKADIVSYLNSRDDDLTVIEFLQDNASMADFALMKNLDGMGEISFTEPESEDVDNKTLFADYVELLFDKLDDLMNLVQKETRKRE